MRTSRLLAAAVVSALGLSVTYVDAAFTPGNLVVVRAGTGAAALNANATAAFLEEFTTLGAPVSTLPMPTAVSGSNQPLTLSGTATSEGFLTLSTDGQYLMMGGYAATPGTSGITAAAASAVNRVVGRVDLLGNIDTTTHLDDAFSGSNIRSATSTNGTDIWISGNAGSGLGATAGVKYTTLGATTGSIRLNDTASNMRVVNIYNGQLYVSSATGSNQGVSTVGTGIPTSGVQTNALALLPGFPTAAGPSSYDFWFLDDDTLYVADDRAPGSGGGIQKWEFDSVGGTWVLMYTLNSGITGGARGLAGTTDSAGNAVLYASANNGAALVSVTDTGLASAFSILATAPTNTAFRGVEFIPIPEPGTLALLGLAGLTLIRRRV